MEGASSEWAKRHPDVNIGMDIDRRNFIYKIAMRDKSHAGRVVNKEYPVKSIPLEQGELVLEDWICSVYEQLYHEIKVLRENHEVS